MKRVAWLLATAIACTGSTKPAGHPDPLAKASGAPEDATMKKTPHGETAFVRGPDVAPAEKLVSWLDAHTGKLVRVPVLLKPGLVGFSTRGVRIGAAADAVELYLEDSRLGIGIADQARKDCAGKPSCAFWVEGYWRGKTDTGYQLDVVRIHAPIAADALAGASYVEVDESGS